MTVLRESVAGSGRETVQLRVHLAIVDFPMLMASFRTVIEACSRISWSSPRRPTASACSGHRRRPA